MRLEGKCGWKSNAEYLGKHPPKNYSDILMKNEKLVECIYCQGNRRACPGYIPAGSIKNYKEIAGRSK